MPGEAATLEGAYRFVRAPLAAESDLTRLVRALLRALKREVLANVSLTVALDYHDGADAGALETVPLTKLPALVVTGPRLVPSPFYSENVPVERAALGPKGPELERLRPPYTADLLFDEGMPLDRSRAVATASLEVGGEGGVAAGGDDP
ncbi:MAG TPA: hypothetical protein VFS43_00450 [Polyangiaceae bacterium]|nr:hypothetical protein [Polyangiaceae bacterium]